MRCFSRLSGVVVVLAATAGLVACTSGQPKASSAPPPTPTEVTQQPTPTPVVHEEVVSQPETTTIPSVEVHEELPQDLVQLNERGYLKDVFFDTDRYDLTESARQTLADNSSWLQDHPSISIRVEGHCDERNTREYNIALGERRAAAVRDYLVFLGVAPERIQTISFGEEHPFAPGHTEAAWKLNRRAHFVIIAR